MNNILRTVVPDAKFGFVLFGDHWHFGAAAPNLLQNKITFTTTNNTADNKLEDHYFIHGGYVFNINDDIEKESCVAYDLGFCPKGKSNISFEILENNYESCAVDGHVNIIHRFSI